MTDSSNAFDSVMRRADAGAATPGEAIDALVAEDTVVAVPMSGVAPDLVPMSLEGPAGTFLAVFSTVERMSEFPPTASGVDAVASVPGRSILATLAPGVGILVNPGSPAGFDIPPAAVLGIRARLG